MTLSTAARAEAEALESGETVATLIVLDHADLAAPIRLVDAALVALGTEPRYAGVVSNGATYIFAPFRFEWPEESATGGGSARLIVPNHDLPAGTVTAVQRELRALSGPLTVTASAISTLDPDVVEAVAPTMLARVSTVDAGSITLELSADLLAEEPMAGLLYRPGTFPGLDPTT